ncbi:MAG: hypothetical protein IMF05_12215 [Proteobacteria bacterium]|nr:hypothetical protein [Pseudomonadota bacterium]
MIERAFRCGRPTQMVRNPGHCDECAEHEEIMQTVTPETVSLDQVGKLAWDPVCYLTDEAWRYFVPGLARLALGRGDGYYLDQFLYHLESGRIDCLNAEQCRALSALMDHLYETMAGEIEENMDDKVLGHVMDLLEQRLQPLHISR